MDKGLLIALEGIDGTGKSTQAKVLASWFEKRGRSVLLTAEPSQGPLGRLVREGLAGKRKFTPGTMALLFASDRLDHLAKVVEPALEQGRVVISDRYLLSSLAYQSVHNNPDWVAAINSRARRPDLTLLLDMGVSECLERLKSRQGFAEIYETAELLGKVRLNYRDLAAQAREAGERVVTVDAAAPLEEVGRAVIQAGRAVAGSAP